MSEYKAHETPVPRLRYGTQYTDEQGGRVRMLFDNIFDGCDEPGEVYVENYAMPDSTPLLVHKFFYESGGHAYAALHSRTEQAIGRVTTVYTLQQLCSGEQSLDSFIFLDGDAQRLYDDIVDLHKRRDSKYIANRKKKAELQDRVEGLRQDQSYGSIVEARKSSRHRASFAEASHLTDMLGAAFVQERALRAEAAKYHRA